MPSSNEATQICPPWHALPTSTNQFFERHKRQYNTHGLRMWASCQTSRQEFGGWDCRKWKPQTRQSRHGGGFTVLDLLTTMAFIFFGFSIMHHWMHNWILAKSLLREVVTAGAIMWSHQHMHIVCSPPAQTFNWYRWWTGIDDEGTIGIHQPRLSAWRWRGTLYNWSMVSTLPPTPIDFNLNKRPLGLTLSRLHQNLDEQYNTPSLYLWTSEDDEIWLAVHQWNPDHSYRQTEWPEKNTFLAKTYEVVRN